MDGARYICLECEPGDDFSRVISHCSHRDCVAATIDRMIPPYGPDDRCVHTPSHDVIKVRTRVHNVLWPFLQDQARSALYGVRASGLAVRSQVSSEENPLDSQVVQAVAEDKDETKREDAGEQATDSSTTPLVNASPLPRSVPLSLPTQLEAEVSGPAADNTQDAPRSPLEETPNTMIDDAIAQPQLTCMICHEDVFLGESWHCITCQRGSLSSVGGDNC